METTKEQDEHGVDQGKFKTKEDINVIAMGRFKGDSLSTIDFRVNYNLFTYGLAPI